MKKFFCLCIAFCTLVFGLSFPTGAEVWTPEIVKTETWTANYYIDPETDATLYPYLDCKADIYNDGTIKVSVANNHEFEGFTTIKHTIVPEWFIEGSRAKTNTTVYERFENSYSISERFKMSIVPNEYSFSGGSSSYYESGKSFYTKYENNYYLVRSLFVWNRSLVEFNNQKYSFTMTPTVEIEKEYKFILFGKEITITPELLKELVKPDPNIDTRTKEEILAENEELKVKNTSLETENEQLKNTITSLTEQLTASNAKIKELTNNLTNTDFNGDGNLTVADLVIYTKFLADRPSKLFAAQGEN